MKKSVSAPSAKGRGERRLTQLASLLRAEVGAQISRGVELPHGVIATVSRVSVAPDFRTAEVAWSVLPFARAAEVLTILNQARRAVQVGMNQKLKLHHVPTFTFTLDERPERAGRIEALLDSLPEVR